MSKIQRQGIKTDTEIVTAGGSIANLPGDDQVYISANSINKTLKQAIEDDDIGGGGASGDPLNYILGTNSNFEKDLGTWNLYSETPGVEPIDGVGPNWNITLVRTTNVNERLNGQASAKLSKDAVNRQGQGARLDIPVDVASWGRSCKIDFNYSATSNFSFGDINTNSDIMVFLYDVDNLQLIRPFPNFLDGSGKFTGFFQCPQTLNLRLIFHIATTKATAYDLIFDEVFLGESGSLNLSADSDWEPWVPVIKGVTTNPTPGTGAVIEGWKRKVGPDLEVVFRFQQNAAGTAGSGTYFLDVPDNLVIDSTRARFVTTDIGAGATVLGHGHKSTTTAAAAFNSRIVSVYARDNRSITIVADATAGQMRRWSSAIGEDYPLSVANLYVTFRARIPIQGWKSGYTTPASVLQNNSATLFTRKNAGTVTANTTVGSWLAIGSESFYIDTLGAFDASTGVYTVKEPGDYFISCQLTANADATGVLTAYVNTFERIRQSVNTSNRIRSVVGILSNCKVGDQITVRNSLTETLFGTFSNHLSITKINSPAALLTFNRSTTKFLGSNITVTTTNIASLAFNNLQIGKRYKVIVRPIAQTNAVNISSDFTAIHNSVTVARSVVTINNSINTTKLEATGYFTATTSTLTFNWAVSGSGGTLFGNGTTAQTSVTLIELNNEIEGNF